MAKARANGIAILAVRKAHHFSAVWPDIEPFAREDSSPSPWSTRWRAWCRMAGIRKLYGTNPLGFAAPRAGTDPLVFDQASTLKSMLHVIV